jgi:hypothetical protein
MSVTEQKLYNQVDVRPDVGEKRLEKTLSLPVAAG